MINKNLKIIHWNCQGLFSKKQDIEKFLISNDVVIINETLVSEESSKFVRFKNSRIYNLHGENGKRGSSIIFRDDLNYDLIHFDTTDLNCELIGISITTSIGIIHIISIYRSPSYLFTPRDWDKLFELIDPYKNQMIFCGDFNLHNEYWGGINDTRHSDYFLDLIFEKDLYILNDKSPTYFAHNGNTSSSIDLTIVSNNLILYSNWCTLDDQLGSDHLPISLTLALELQINPFITHKFSFTKFNWNMFSNLISDKMEELNLIEDVNYLENYDKFNNLVKECICSMKESNKNRNIITNDPR